MAETTSAPDIESALRAVTGDHGEEFTGEPTRRTTPTALSEKVQVGELDGADALHILSVHGRAEKAR